MPSSKIRELEDDLIFNYVTESDKTSTWQQENLTPPTGKLPSENIQETYQDIGAVIDMLRGGGGEIYDDEGNVIAYGGTMPDIAAIPFVSKKSIGNLLGKFIGKDRIVKALRSLSSKKLYPEIAKPSKINAEVLRNLKKKGLDPAGLVSGEPTLFGKFIESRSKNRLYKRLATKDEFKKFKNTYGPDYTYEDYNNMLKNNIFGEGKINYRIGERILGPDNTSAFGGYNPKTNEIILASRRNPPELGTTIVHETMHKMHSAVTDKYTSPAYKSLEKLLKGHTKPGTSEFMMTAVGSPTETLARTGQLKSKGIVQSISESLGVPTKARGELEELYSKKFIDSLINKYWAAAPVGLGLDEDLFKEIKE